MKREASLLKVHLDKSAVTEKRHQYVLSLLSLSLENNRYFCLDCTEGRNTHKNDYYLRSKHGWIMEEVTLYDEAIHFSINKNLGNLFWIDNYRASDLPLVNESYLLAVSAAYFPKTPSTYVPTASFPHLLTRLGHRSPCLRRAR